MGIPFFYKWLKNTHRKKVLRRNLPFNVSSFNMDFNGIIHEAAQEIYAYGEKEDAKRAELIKKADPLLLEAELHAAISEKLLKIHASVNPAETTVLAVDGVAPQAKIAQQRQRRYKSALSSLSGEAKVFDSNCITPGTDFMMRLDNFIQRWLVANNKILPPKVVYSSHMVPGEGEHKIMDLFRSGEVSGEGIHVIYGMDADLIMLSLLAPVNNIFLMREDINDVIDIEALKEVIREELGTPTAIEDFVIMLYLLGNDFLPHMPTFSDLEETIETMIRIYRMNGKSLSGMDGDEKTLNWEGFVSFLRELAREEARLLEMESMREVKFPSRMMELAIKRTSVINAGLSIDKVKKTSTFDYNVFRSAWYDNAFKNKGDESVFRKLMPGYKFGLDNNKIVEMAKSYLTGISWVYRYYNTGKGGINDEYVYRYHYSPLLLDISIVASNFIVTPEMYHFNDEAPIINPVHQLLAVMPLKSKNLIPEEVRHLTKSDSVIADYFPKDAIIEKDGVNNDWQGTILINFVDMERILSAVENTSIFSESRIKVFSEVYNIILQKDSTDAQMAAKSQRFKQFLASEMKKEYGGRGRGRGYRNEQSGGRGYQQNTGKGRGYQSGGRGYQKPEWKPSEYQKPDWKPSEYQKPAGGRGRGRGRGGYNKEGYNKEVVANPKPIPPIPVLAQPSTQKMPLPLPIPPLKVTPKVPLQGREVQKFEL